MSNDKKTPRKRLPSMATVARPDVRYAVQAAMSCQKNRIYLIDPQSKTYIDGLINSPAIYLSFTPPWAATKKILRKRMGFIPDPPDEIVDGPQELVIDATLYFSYPDQEVFSGYDEKTGITVMVIQVWHDAEVEKWRKIGQKIATELIYETKDERNPTVHFYITSASLPFDPEAPHQLIIPVNSECNHYQEAISHRYLDIPDNDYFDDE